MLIIPAIDIKNGKVVRLEQGNYDKETSYSDNPIETALKWQEEGASLIHIVDLDGARAGAMKNIDCIMEIAKKLTVPIQVGGGIRTLDTVKKLYSAGIKRVILGTKICQDISLVSVFIKHFKGKVIAGLDIKDNVVAIGGWISLTPYSPSERNP
jgi:phosphoribosylformimino-5-aminoimidazole carboxamide ribotide isomerase